MDTEQAKFDGWAVVDILGHQRFVGYVTTQAFGAAVMFRIDVPALEPRDRVTKSPEYVGHNYVPAGTTVKEGPVDGYSKLVGAGSIYMITPCTEAAALVAVEKLQPRPLLSVDLPAGTLALPARGHSDQQDLDDQDDDGDLDDDGSDAVECENCSKTIVDVANVFRTADDVELCEDCYRGLVETVSKSQEA
jgi:hypothetical protein